MKWIGMYVLNKKNLTKRSIKSKKKEERFFVTSQKKS
jgi:hypothetical protein